MGYDPKAIEAKWQQLWAEEKTWEVANPGQPGFDGSKPKSYVLEMLPYPSGEPHVGHLKCYAVGDAIAHFRRRHGFEVIHPMGYDSFGLPAENNAIKTGEPPRAATERSIESFRRQFREWGISIDWSRELATHTPEYYRWTQWIFLRLLERGLAYREEAPVQWCPKDATVLANEQVVDGRCERCGTPVEQRRLEQWFFRITEYADRLLADFDLLESWPEHVVTMQRNWIGRSEGAEVTFRCEELELDFPVFTTRPDTLFGASFFVLAPEHPELERLVAGTPAEAEVREYVNRVARESAEERGDEDREKTGVPLGRSVVNPVNGERDPDVRRRLRADGVRHRGDHGRPRPRQPRLRVRQGLRPAGQARDRGFRPGGGARRGRAALSRRRADDRLGALRRQAQSRGLRGDRRLAGRGGPRRIGCQLPPARLAGLAPALLGRADPGRLLRGLWRGRRAGDRPRPRRAAAGRAAGDRRLRAAGPQPARRRRGLGRHRVPALRRPGAPRDRHDGHLRRLLLVLHPLPRPAQRGGRLGPRRRRPLAAGRPVHRRGRARDPAPDVRALLHQGARRPRDAHRAGAVRQPLHPRDDHPRRRQDVEVEGQHGQPGRVRRALRRRHGALLRLLHGPARARRRLVRRGSRGRQPLPLAPLAPLRGGR